MNQYVPPTQKELDRLYHLNRLDIELYEYAKELSNYTITSYMNRKYQRKSEQQQQQQHREQDESTITSKSTSSTLNDNTGTKYYSDKELDLTCNRPKQKLSENHANILIGGKGCTISKPDKIGMYYFPNSCLLHSYAADSAFGYSNRKQKSIDEDMNAVRKRKIRNTKFCQSI